MAIDTKAKQLSAISMAVPWGPLPDAEAEADLTQEQALHLVRAYNGFGVPEAIALGNTITDRYWRLPAQNRTF